jgi:hypothetical protein
LPDEAAAFRDTFRRRCQAEEFFPREIEKTIRRFCPQASPAKKCIEYVRETILDELLL